MAIIQDPVTGQWIDDITGMPAESQNPSVATPSFADSGAPVMPQQQPANVIPFNAPTAPPQPGPVAPQGPVLGNIQDPRSHSQSAGTTQFEPSIYESQLPIRNALERKQATAQAEIDAVANKGAKLSADAANTQQLAQKDYADALAGQIDAQKTALEEKSKLEGKMIVAEKAATEISRTQVAAARGRFDAQVQAVRAMSVDPTLNFTPAALVGMTGALFAQGFLGARGINIDVQGTIERWTDRYVDNQMEKIKRGEKLLDSEQVIWNMVRADAADEADARQSLRAMTMAQADTAMQIETARWGAPLAAAQGKIASAAIQAGYAATVAKQDSERLDRTNAMLGRISQDHWAGVAAANASRNAATAEGQLQLERDKEANKASIAPRMFFSYPDAQGNRVPIGVPRAGVDPDGPEMKAAADVYGKGRDVLSAVENLRGILTENGAPLSTAQVAARFQSGGEALTKAAYAQLVLSLRNADRQTMGANFTTNEEALLKGQINLPTFFTRVGVEDTLRLLDNVGERQLNLTDHSMDQVLQDPTPDGAYKAWSGSVAPNLREQYKAGKDARTPNQDTVQKSEAAVTGPQSSPDTTPGGFAQMLRDDYGNTHAIRGGGPINAGADVEEKWVEPLRVITELAVKGDARAMESLTRMAATAKADGATGREQAVNTVLTLISDSNDPARSAEAKARLNAIVADRPYIKGEEKWQGSPVGVPLAPGQQPAI